MVAFLTYDIAGVDTGTAGRNVQEWLSDVKNVKDFGATGDGSTDDWTAIMDAITWNSINLVTTGHAYSGSLRVASASWDDPTNTITMVTTEAHGLTNGDQVNVRLCFSSGSPGQYDGAQTVTVTNSTTFTYTEATDPKPLGFPGQVLPLVTSAAWATDVVTINYGAPHRLISTLSCRFVGLTTTPSSALTSGSSHTITVTSPTQITIPIIGSGTVNGASSSVNTLIQPLPILTIASPGVPATINQSSGQSLAQFYPTCDGAASYLHTISAFDTGADTITFGTQGFLADIPTDTEVRVTPAARGTLFFPTGQYRVGQQIPFSDHSLSIKFLGSGGSTIIGDVTADYLIDRDVKVGSTGPIVMEKMRFVNENVTGGGMRLCQVGIVIRDCVFEANKGFLSSSTDYRNAISFSIVLANCIFTLVGGKSGSIGAQMPTNDASLVGNYFNGFGEAIRTMNFARTMRGNRFIDCDVGVSHGIDPLDATGSAAHELISGNYFENCGTAIWLRGGGNNLRIEGNYILAGAASDYGFRNGTSDIITGSLRGLDISGTFAAGDGMSLPANNGGPRGWLIRAVRSDSWNALTTTAHSYKLIECNNAQLHVYSELSGRAVTNATWSGGTVTLTTHATHGITAGQVIRVSGIKVGGSLSNGYNGDFTNATASGSTITYAVVSDPGTYDAGTGGVTKFQNLWAALQGEFFNITDGQNIATGTANIGDRVTGGASQNIKVGWSKNGWVRYG